MYEHAYQMDYGAAAGKYIDTFMKNVNWAVVNLRFTKVQKAMAAMQT
jgi:superoxide dismutase, Fe-Mn family